MRASLALLVTLIITTGLLPLASADDDSLKVVVLVEDKVYNVGTSGKVTVHVFDRGAHVDADVAPEVSIGIYPQREISVSRTSTGVYQGTFALESGDVAWGYAVVSATATLDRSDDSDITYNEDSASAIIPTSTTSGEGFRVRCYLKSVSDSVPRGGTKVVVAAEVTRDGSPVAPDDFGLSVSYYAEGGYFETEDLEFSNPSRGVYESDPYTIPNLSYGTDFDFEASASHGGDDYEASVSISCKLFTVIYHNVSRGERESTFDLYVADQSGRPVKGATIEIKYYADGDYEDSIDAGPTDDGGRARVTLHYSSGTQKIYIEGMVTAGARRQRFDGEILLSTAPSTPQPSGDEFEVVFAGPQASYKPGQSITRDYVVFNNSRPWSGKEVYCYITSGTAYVSAFMFTQTAVEGRVLTTDASGKLRLTVTAPSGKNSYFQVNFESATGVHPKPGGWYSDHDSIDGKYYSEDSDYFMAHSVFEGSLEVTVEALNLGSPTKITATARSGDPPVAAVGWGVGEISDPSASDHSANWQVWSRPTTYFTKSGSTYSGSVVIPSFMPGDQSYSVTVRVEGKDGLAWGIASLKPGEGRGKVAAGGLPLLYIGLAALVLIVVVVAALFVVRRRRARAPAAPPAAPGAAEGVAPEGPAWPAAPAQGAAPPVQPQYQPPPQPLQPPSMQPQLYAQPAPPQLYQPQPPAYAPPPQPQPVYAPTPPAQAQPPPGYATQPHYPQPQPPAYPPPYQQPFPPQAPPAQPPAPVLQPQAAAPRGASRVIPPPAEEGDVSRTSLPTIPPRPEDRGVSAKSVTLPNNVVCAFCNQWALQGSKGVLCSCGKCYHEQCARMIGSCVSCKTKLTE
ncbi:MAG: hypothetical protein ACUVV6_00020 [Thermoplasmatota archaeon]